MHDFINVAPGGDVAVLPSEDAAPDQTLEVAKVAFSGTVFIELQDGRRYSKIGGNCLLNGAVKTFIVPATDLHRLAVKR